MVIWWYQFVGTKRVGAFIAQIGHESCQLLSVREIWADRASVRYECRKVGLDENLPAKTPRQALKSGHCCQPLDPLCAPVCFSVRGFGLAGHSAGCIALIFSCLLVGIGIAATAAFHTIELSACRQLFAFVATGQMPVNVEMDNHELSPLRRVLLLTTHALCRSAVGRRQKNTRMRAGERVFCKGVISL